MECDYICVIEKLWPHVGTPLQLARTRRDVTWAGMAKTALPATDSAAPPPISEHRCTVHGTLGRGGMAIVHDATEIATGRRVALKRLQPTLDAHQQRRNAELFEREFQALKQLEHPHIVEVYDYGIDRAGPYYTRTPPWPMRVFAESSEAETWLLSEHARRRH